MSDATSTEPAPTLLHRMGGVSGLVVGAVPSVAYTVVNAVAGLTAAIVVAVGISVGLIFLRRLRKESITPAVSGLLGVVLAVSIAYYTGSVKGFFLPGIWMSLAMAVVFAVSVVVRRPLVGVIWNVLTGADGRWHTDPVARRAFDVATLTFVVVFAARFVVQDWLYDAGSTGWLAFARIAMGYPLVAVALLVTYWAVRRARGRHSPARGLANAGGRSR